jgi:A/G-specific adenine glycosylase
MLTRATGWHTCKSEEQASCPRNSFLSFFYYFLWMQPDEQHIKELHKKVMNFYTVNKRDLPWRKTVDPYHIMLSEVMLQQTQVDRVKEKYLLWTTKWPTIGDLARAERKEVLAAWMGLGYNNRAVRLHETAKKISTEYQGDVIGALRSGEKLPGIGPYTSRAIRIFAANENICTVDTNIRRILIKEYNLKENTSEEALYTLAGRCVPEGKSREWHNALMDYGAIYLTSRVTGIKPRTRQGRFEGSDRQARAQVLSYLLKHDQVDKNKLANAIGIKGTKLVRVLASLKKDDLIHERKSTFELKNSS